MWSKKMTAWRLTNEPNEEAKQSNAILHKTKPNRNRRSKQLQRLMALSPRFMIIMPVMPISDDMLAGIS